MLALVIVLSGCFGLGANDSDGHDTSSSTNMLPVIYIEAFDFCGEGQGCDADGDRYADVTAPNTTFISLSVAWDFDGIITQFGVDWTMDGVIDQGFTDNFSNHTVRYANASYDWMLLSSDVRQEYPDYLEGRQGYQFVNVIAIDDDGGTTIIPLRAEMKSGEGGYQYHMFPDYYKEDNYR